MGLGTGAVEWAPGMGCAANSTHGPAFGFTLGLGEAAWGQQGWEPWDVPCAMFCRHWGLAVSGLAVSIVWCEPLQHHMGALPFPGGFS